MAAFFTPNRLGGILSCLLVCLSFMGSAATLPYGFAETRLATGLDPTGIELAPDGRVFISEKPGRIRIVKNGVLLPTPFLTLTVNNDGERGLQSVAFDPNFATNHYVYVYYTATTPTIHNRVSRFTANGDVALAGSEVAVFDMPTLDASYHNGGSMLFLNGKLLIGTGENAVQDNSQSFATTLGKILRINTDGTIPTDNPYYSSTTGNNRAIYALGFRNPFKMAIQPGTNVVAVNDVGEDMWEEINILTAGKNYGWPLIEGKRTTQTPPANYQDPIYQYDHNNGCSITGGAFYNPTTTNWPAGYVGKYLFADYCYTFIKTLDLTSYTEANWARNINSCIDVKVAGDGSVYYVDRGTISDASATNVGELYRIYYKGDNVPTISAQPMSQTGSTGGSVTFEAHASGLNLSFQWQRNGVNIAGATNNTNNVSTYTLSNLTAGDNGAQFRVVVTNSDGTVTSAAATLTVTGNQPPAVSITSPANGTIYRAGDRINFTATASDAEDGTLPAGAYQYTVVFHHLQHTHPGPSAVVAADGKSGYFDIPTSGESSASVWYRLMLKVTDSQGAYKTDSVDVEPKVVTLTLQSNPTGLTLNLEGQPQTTPYHQQTVAGLQLTLAAPAYQKVNGVGYSFVNWNPAFAGGSITVPDVSSTYTATYTTLVWQWVRQAASSGIDHYNRCRTDVGGNVYAAGAFSGTATFDGKSGSPSTLSYSAAGGTDGVLCRYDRSGALQWAARFGSAGNDDILGLATDAYGYAYVSGYFSNTLSIQTTSASATTLVSAGGTDAFVAKVHPDGHLVYAFRFGAAANDQANGVDIAPDGHLYVAGSFSGTTTVQGISGTAITLTSRGNSDAFLAKFSDIGTIYWLIQAGGTGNDYAYGAAADKTGGGYLLGSYEGTATYNSSLGGTSISKTAVGGSDGFVLGVSITGALSWVASMGGTTNENVRDLAPDPRGTGVVAVGGFSSSATFGSTTLAAAGYYDAFAVRLSNAGAFQWATKAGGMGQDQAWAVRLDKLGNAFVGLSFSQSSTNFGSALATLTSQGGTDGLVAQLAPATGIAVLQSQIGGTGDDQALGIDTSGSGGILAAGAHGPEAVYGPQGPYTDAGLGDAWAGKFAKTAAARMGVAEEGMAGSKQLVLYPNPTPSGRFTLQMADAKADALLQLYDPKGRCVYSQSVSGSALREGINLSLTLPTGLYALRCAGSSGRLMIQ